MVTSPLANALRHCTLFRAASDDVLEDMAAACTRQELRPAEVLFHAGQRAEVLYVVLSGTLKVYCTADDGREQVLHLFGTGDVCGEVPMFEGSCYPASAASTDPCTVIVIPRATLLGAFRRHPELPLAMLAELSRRLRRFVNLVDDLSLKDVETRLMEYLEALASRQGMASVTLPVSKAVLAARLGTIPETLSRTLKRLEQRGALRVEGRTIHMAPSG